MVIYLVSLLPARSNGLPRGTNEAEPLHPSLFSLSPSGVCHASDVTIRAVGSYIKSILIPVFNQGNDPTISPLFHQKDGTVYFLLHFPSRHRDSPVPGTLPLGAPAFPPLPPIRENSRARRPPRLLNLQLTLPHHPKGKKPELHRAQCSVTR